MIRKLAASTFLALMAAVLAFQHPALGYCGCSHDFFIADCECKTEIKSPCSCCQDSCQDAPQTAPTPCDDCCQKISCDSDDLFWSPLPDPSPPTESTPIATSFLELPSKLTQPTSPLYTSSPRPPPDGLPLFLRLGVMRL